jgi:hypothetical protein
MSLGAKHSGRKSLQKTNRLSAGMLRPYGYIWKKGMLPIRQALPRAVASIPDRQETVSYKQQT